MYPQRRCLVKRVCRVNGLVCGGTRTLSRVTRVLEHLLRGRDVRGGALHGAISLGERTDLLLVGFHLVAQLGQPCRRVGVGRQRIDGGPGRPRGGAAAAAVVVDGALQGDLVQGLRVGDVTLPGLEWEGHGLRWWWEVGVPGWKAVPIPAAVGEGVGGHAGPSLPIKG